MSFERLPPTPSTSYLDSRNQGFVPPKRLVQLRNDSDQLTGRHGSLLTGDMSDTSASEAQDNNTPSPPVPSKSTTTSTTTPAPTHSRSNSLFTSFRSRVSAVGPAGRSHENTGTSRHHQSVSSPLPSASVQPQSAAANEGDPVISMSVALSPQRQATIRQESSTSTATTATATSRSSFGNGPDTQQQLHPEIRSVVQLTVAHAHKIYFSGPFVKRVERQPDGNRPAKDHGWIDVWAQLGGTTMSIWNMEEIAKANERGEEVPPTYINITDAFVQVLGSVTIPATATTPSKKYSNVVTVNTAGSNLLLFSCPSPHAVIAWASALRLSAWEKSRLEEIYTAHLLRISLRENGQWRDPRSPLIRGKMEGWARIRIAGQTDWKRLWLVVQAGAGHEPHNGTASDSSPDLRSSSLSQPRRHRMSSFFNRMHDHVQEELPQKPSFTLYDSAKPKDRKKVMLTMTDVSQVFAVYPERPELISRSTLIKVEGLMGDEEITGTMRSHEGWILMMPEVEPGKLGSTEMLKWLVAMHDAFSLYGRPPGYTWDPRDPVSMMFGYPVGQNKELLFLDREMAESLDPRDERTSIVRSNLKQILVDRVHAESASSHSPAPGRSSTDGPPLLPPIQGISRSDGPSGSPSPRATPPQPTNSTPVLPPLDFEKPQPQPGREHVSTPPTSGLSRTQLSPITERSTLPGSAGTTRQSTGETTASPKHSRQQSFSSTGAGGSGSNESRNAQTVLQEQPLVGRTLVSSPPSAIAEVARANVTSPSSAASTHSQDSFRRSASIQVAARTPIRPMPTMEEKPEPADIMLPNSPSLSLGSTPSTLPKSPSVVSTSTPPTSPPMSPPPPPPPPISTGLRGRPISTVSSVMSYLPTPSYPQPPSNLLAGPSHPSSIRSSIGEESVNTSRSSEDKMTSKPMPVVHEVPVDTAPDSDDFHSAPGALYYMQQQQHAKQQFQAAHQATVSSESNSDTGSESEEPADRRPVSAAPSGRTVAGPVPQAPVLSRKPSGARAPLPVSTRRFVENASPSPSPSLGRPPPSQGMSNTANGAQDPAQVADSSLEDQAADALAALNFLEQDHSPPRPPERAPEKQATWTPPIPEVIEPEDRAPSPPSNQYRSSFAPSKQAAERKARLQAQQAAHNEAVHKPGRPNGKVTKPKDRGAWNASSDEEEEAEEEDEEVDSDEDQQAPSSSRIGLGPPPSLAAGPRAPIPQAAGYQNQFRGSSPSRSTSEPALLQQQQLQQQRASRVLPQIPDRRSPAGPDEFQGPQPRYPSAQFTDGPRRTYMDDGSHAHYSAQIRSQSEAPIPGAARQNMWSTVLDNKANPSGPPTGQNSRDTFVQLETPAETLTKAFTPQGLLSAGLQDKEDRSAKRQEVLARESGSSLISVPNKPPPPQVGLLGVVAAHERERKREGGMGAALTERERERRHAEEQQRKLDEYQRQQQQMMQSGSMYGMYGGGLAPQMAGYNPMMGQMGAPYGNPQAMMPPMYYNPMLSPMGYPNPQQMFAAQQAAQAYQQAMMAMSVAGSQIGGSQIGGDDGGHQGPMFPPGSPGPMMGQGNMNMGPMGMGYDPRMSMMGMGMGMMSPMGMPGMLGPQSPAPMGMQMGGGGNPMFDPRLSMASPSYENMRPFSAPFTASPVSGNSPPGSSGPRGGNAYEERPKASENMEHA